MEQASMSTAKAPESLWMGAFRILPCTDADKHNIQASEIVWAEEAGRDCDITYCNALYCGVFPCFVSHPVDTDATCIQVAWPDESYEEVIAANGASRKQPGLIQRALLAHHLFGLGSSEMDTLSTIIKLTLQGEYSRVDYDQWKPFAPIFDWVPASCGEAHLAKLKELFPPPCPLTAGT